MMLPSLQDRFNQLLGFAKDPSFRVTCKENLAAAREMVETLLITGHLDVIEYRAHHQQITTIKLMIGAEELKRVADLIDKSRKSFADENGIRPAVSDDGAYRFNPFSGGFE